jgi:hypothetical protein
MPPKWSKVIGSKIILWVSNANACGTLNFCRALSSWTLAIVVYFSGRSDEFADWLLTFGVEVKVTSRAKNGTVLLVLCMLGLGTSWRPISAGRNVGNDGSVFGGSNCTSVTALVILAIGASLVRIWKHVSRMRLCMVVLDAAVQEKRWSPYGSRADLALHVHGW